MQVVIVKMVKKMMMRYIKGLKETQTHAHRHKRV